MSQYRIDAIDARTYAVLETSGSGKRFFLMVSTAYGDHYNVQITLAEITSEHKSDSYVEFARETFTFKSFVADWHMALSFLNQIISELNNGTDASNPAEIAIMFGGELNGEVAQWPPYPLEDLN